MKSVPSAYCLACGSPHWLSVSTDEDNDKDRCSYRCKCGSRYVTEGNLLTQSVGDRVHKRVIEQEDK